MGPKINWHTTQHLLQMLDDRLWQEKYLQFCISPGYDQPAPVAGGADARNLLI